jgi:hypothetical protein
MNCKCLLSITVDVKNVCFSIDRYFVVDNREKGLVLYFGESSGVYIWKEIEVLGKSCFACSNLETVTFESESRLTRIEESCFEKCSMKSICIPRNVEILGKSCFYSSKLESFTFESESRLTRMEE